MFRRSISSRGIALISVLWVLILLSVLAAGLMRSSRTQVNLARNAADSAQAEALTEAGLSLAVLNLLQQNPSDRWQVNGAVYGWRFGGGEMRISVQDEAGKVDLNATDPELLAAFFEAAGAEPREAEALSEALADYRDSDQDPRAFGAEDSDYEAAGYDHEAKDDPFTVIEELRLVYGMQSELYDRLAPAVTVYSRQSRPHAALAGPLARAVLDGEVSRSSGEEDRDDSSNPVAEFNGDEQTGPTLLGGAPRGAQPHSGTLGIHVEARLDDGAVFVREAVVRLAPGQVPPYHLLAWRQGVRQHFP